LLAVVREAIATAPLVTLVGPGGVGKTRLAQEVADVQDPVWWVDLAPLRDPDAVPFSVADAGRNRALLVTTLRNLVVLLARTGRDEAAAALAASLQEAAPSRSYGAEAARIATALAAVRRRLGEAAYDGAWAAGAARTLEEAADGALRLLDPGPDRS
jgi:predicted ATPase